jgi:ABC-type sugar transport system substrate-binding protein
MKKMFMTAVALVAFSAVSMAKTKGIVEKTEYRDCWAAAGFMMAAIEELNDVCFSPSDYNNGFYEIMQICVDQP